jgi:adenine-specific DNA-methyltransferase
LANEKLLAGMIVSDPRIPERFTKLGYSAKASEFDHIYVNDGKNLENIEMSDDPWKVRLVEEDVHRLMFEMECV